MILFYDTLFRQKRKGDKWKVVDAPQPALEGPVADTHCHLHMTPEPAFALARAALNSVPFVCCITDPTEDGLVVFEQLEQWREDAADHICQLQAAGCLPITGAAGAGDSLGSGAPAVVGAAAEGSASSGEPAIMGGAVDGRAAEGSASSEGLAVVGAAAEGSASSGEPAIMGGAVDGRAADFAVPATPITVGCHPHNAKLFDDAAESQLRQLLQDPRVCALGEIGLDYHYDLSPREDQRRVFVRQVRIAKELGLPVSLHIREAHQEAFALMEEEGWPEAGTLLHCCTVGPDDLQPWIDAGCYVTFGGAMTFNNGEAIRQAMLRVPDDRLLTETDTPYMAPVPLRGSDCAPDFVLFTAANMAELRGHEPGAPRQEFLAQLYANALRLLGR